MVRLIEQGSPTACMVTLDSAFNKKPLTTCEPLGAGRRTRFGALRSASDARWARCGWSGREHDLRCQTRWACHPHPRSDPAARCGQTGARGRLAPFPRGGGCPPAKPRCSPRREIRCRRSPLRHGFRRRSGHDAILA
jgi:hypothetical protein